MAEQRNDRFTDLEEHYAGYEVYDRDGDKIGKVDDLFVDENDNPEYLGVKMGFLGLKSTLIPWDIARANERERRIEVSVDKDTAKEGPAFDDDEEITPEYEERVRNHYGLGSTQGAGTRGAYGAYSGRGPTGEERSGRDPAGEERLGGERRGGGSAGGERLPEERAGRGFAGEERPGAGIGGAGHERGSYADEERQDRERERLGEERRGGGFAGEKRPGVGGADRERGGYASEERRDREREHLGEERPGTGGAGRGREESRERPGSPGREGVAGRGGGLQDEDELRVQRTEEELRAGTREREAGGVHVRKRVKTEREQVRVPKKREEVHVERVPVEGREASAAEIGEDEIFMPVTEEEVVVQKEPVVKEEIRLRKDVTRDEEVVEEDVRKEEIDVDDQSDLRGGGRGTDVVGDETRRREETRRGDEARRRDR